MTLYALRPFLFYKKRGKTAKNHKIIKTIKGRNVLHPFKHCAPYCALFKPLFLLSLFTKGCNKE